MNPASLFPVSGSGIIIAPAVTCIVSVTANNTKIDVKIASSSNWTSEPTRTTTYEFDPNMSYGCNCCSRRFNSSRAQWQHKYDKNHFDWECHCCDETYETESMCEEHEVEDHLYCADCDRSFRNLNNIQQHLRSSVHVGASIACPFCKRGFATATGLVHHIEGSACPNAKGIDRDAVYRLVRQKDPSGVISKNLIGWTGSDSFEATARAWNPYAGAYECYLCHRTFGQLSSLNQHLQSPFREFLGFFSVHALACLPRYVFDGADSAACRPAEAVQLPQVPQGIRHPRRYCEPFRERELRLHPLQYRADWHQRPDGWQPSAELPLSQGSCPSEP